MVTGDYHHTAIAVARNVGLLSPDSSVMLIDTVKASPCMAQADKQVKVSHMCQQLPPSQQAATAMQVQHHPLAASASHRQDCHQLQAPDKVQGVSQSSSQAQAPLIQALSGASQGLSLSPRPGSTLKLSQGLSQTLPTKQRSITDDLQASAGARSCTEPVMQPSVLAPQHLQSPQMTKSQSLGSIRHCTSSVAALPARHQSTLGRHVHYAPSSTVSLAVQPQPGVLPLVAQPPGKLVVQAQAGVLPLVAQPPDKLKFLGDEGEEPSPDGHGRGPVTMCSDRGCL